MQIKTDHIHFRCQDPVKAREFFVNIMGADDLGPMEVVSGMIERAALGDYRLFFSPAAAAMDVEPNSGRPRYGVYQLAWAVPSLAEALEEVKSRGGVIAKEPFAPRPGLMAAFVQGPEGVEVELMEYVD